MLKDIEGSEFTTSVEITDTAKSGPFNLKIFGAVVAPKEKKEPQPRQKPEQKVDVAPSRPDVVEVDRRPDEPPLTIEKVPNSERMKLLINTGSHRLIEAKSLRPPEEAAAVEFVFKYGLALITMSLLDTATKTDDWKTDPDKIRDGISKSSEGIARVIVCLSLPSKLPKAARNGRPISAICRLGQITDTEHRREFNINMNRLVARHASMKMGTTLSP
jgi:hypothetical protein